MEITTKQKIPFKVCVCCFTFNHSPYINDTMNGFTMQQTEFPFVCVIVDDASTDGEPEVIKNYLHEHFDLEDKDTVRNEETDDYVMTFARHMTNNNCYFVVFFLKYNHYSISKSKTPYIQEWTDTKYTALCEGDDYWINPEKLQRQFNFMESRLECSMCFHSAFVEYPDGHQEKHEPKIKKLFYKTDDVITDKGGTTNLSYMQVYNSNFFRNQYLKKEGYPDFWRLCPIGDLPLRLYMSVKGDIGYIDEVMSVYKRFTAGSWTSRQLKTSLKDKLDHKRKMLMMWSRFDEYTHYKYHRIIKRNIYKNRISMLKCILKHPLGKILSVLNS